MEAARVAMVQLHLPLSPKQLQAVWREQDHQVWVLWKDFFLIININCQMEADFTPEKFFHLHDIDMSGAIDKQVSNNVMIVTKASL